MGFFDQMKDIAGKVGNTVEKGAKSISDSSKKMAEKSKLKSEISQIENELNSAYISIGKVYFEKLLVNPEPECANAVDTIIKQGAKVEQLRNQLNSLEDKIPCANCGASLSKEQKFCDKCGAKVEVPSYSEPAEPVITPVAPEPVSAEKTSGKVCPECNTPADDDQLFCQQCGKKF